MKIGYVRVSTEEQNEARQIEALRAQGVEKIFQEKISGKNADRPQLKEMLNFCREGDIIIVESFSRLSRNLSDLLNIGEQLRAKGADFMSLKENIDTSTPQGRFTYHIWGAMAEFERENILQRQKEGIAIAKAEGKYKGRKPIDVDKKAFREICVEWRAGKITGVEAACRAGLKKNTFYRRVKDMGL